MIKDIFSTLLVGSFRLAAVLMSLMILFVLGHWVQKIWPRLKQSPPPWVIDTLIVALIIMFIYVIGAQ